MKTTALYLRVSSKQQNLDSQLAAAHAWIEQQHIEPDTVQWYTEKESGTTMARPELQRLKDDVANGKIGTVVVWKLDRLSRSMYDGMVLLSAWMKAGVRFVSITQQIDFSGALGGLFAALLLAFAQIETEYRRERQMAGIAEAKKKGVYKYRKQRERGPKADPNRARELRNTGLNPDEIANALGITRRTVFAYLAQTKEAA